MADAFPLNPGQMLRRVELHERLGGRRQGGISPSRETPNVFIFTDPQKGARHGYLYDGWADDGLFHYTGEGQTGDQLMAQGNRSIRDHEEEGRALRLFDVSQGEATYVGELEYVDHHDADAPETGDGPIRSVIVFRLRPRGIDPGPPNQALLSPPPTASVKEVPVEQHLTERFVISGDREPAEGERREQKLVRAFMSFLTAAGHDVKRLQLQPPGEPAPLFCDLFDKTTNTLFEAKGSVARPAIRMAIGQLADYSRLVDPSPGNVILVPQAPREDLIRLANGEGISVVWSTGDGFESSEPDLLDLE